MKSSSGRPPEYIFVNRFFYPDHSATSQILTDLAFHLAERGYAVRVVTSAIGYDATTGFQRHERIAGVEVERVWTSRFGRQRLALRAVDYATFYLSAAWKLVRLARAGDIVVSMTDPPLISIVTGAVARLRGARSVNWLQDVFPEVAQAAFVGRRSLVAAFAPLVALRNSSLVRAGRNVVLGTTMEQRLIGMGVDPAKIAVIENWMDASLVRPVPQADNALRNAWGLTNKFVVGYSGNLGRVHEIDTIVDAMTVLERGREEEGRLSIGREIVWLFVGGGALIDALKIEIERRKIRSVLFKPYQAREELAFSLSVPDVHLVSLRPEFEGLVVPSKLYGIMAAGRPALFVGDHEGEVATVLRRHECGLTISIGDGAGLAAAVVRLADDPALCREMGDRARLALETRYDKAIAAEKWESLLIQAGGQRGAAPKTI